jgi:hypothetical protein
MGREDILKSAAEWSFHNEKWSAGTTIDHVNQYASSKWKVFSAENPSDRGLDREILTTYSLDGEESAGKPRPGRALGMRAFDSGDVALIKVEAKDAPTLQLAGSVDLGVGSEVVSIGYAASVDDVTDATFDPSFKDGTVSSERTTGNGLVKVYEISAAVSGGMSGGPTVDLQGRVVGVNSFNNRYETQAFNFITPASEIRSLLADEGVKNEAGKMTELYREGLAAYYEGDRELALASFDGVIEIADEHGMARDMRAKAQRLPVAEQNGGGLPIVPLIALLLLAGAGGAAWRFRPAGGPSGGGAPRRPTGPRPSLGRFVPAGGIRKPVRSVRKPNAPVAQQPAADGPALVAVEGPLKGERFEVDGVLSIGRESGDVVLDDAEVSRRHAEVQAVDGTLVVSDVGSSNGTDVNGRRCDAPTTLSEGDRVQIGATVFLAELGAQACRTQETVLRSLPRRDETAPRAVVR